MPSDIEIARSARPRPIAEIDAQLGLLPQDLRPYGHDVAKLGRGGTGRLAGLCFPQNPLQFRSPPPSRGPM
jgi:hypothetical protein